MAVLLLAAVAPASDPARYRVVSERKTGELELRLQESAAEGYRLVGAAAGWHKFAKCGVVHLLLERLPDNRVPPEYLVMDEGAYLATKGLDRLNEAGARGFRVPDQGVVERACDTWGGMTWEIVLILERTDPEARFEYVAESLPRPRPGWPVPGPWPALAAWIADGYRLVGFTRFDGAILSRQEGADPVGEIEPDHFLLVSNRGKKNRAKSLDVALAEGFRFAEDPYPGWGMLLLEKSAEPGRGYEYRFLPKLQKAFPLINELGAEGFRAHRTARIMEREPPVESAYDYRFVEARPPAELTEKMAGLAAEGWSLVTFGPLPKEAFFMLLERPKPDIARPHP